MKTKEYCLGFIFTPDGGSVLLQLKQKPDWQRNKFNGIGGHVEEGESPGSAMTRECMEETGIEINFGPGGWQHVCELRGDGFCVYVYAAFTEDIAKSNTRHDQESVHIYNVNALPDSCIPNLRWLIPMALSLTRGESVKSFVVTEHK